MMVSRECAKCEKLQKYLSMVDEFGKGSFFAGQFHSSFSADPIINRIVWQALIATVAPVEIGRYSNFFRAGSRCGWRGFFLARAGTRGRGTRFFHLACGLRCLSDFVCGVARARMVGLMFHGDESFHPGKHLPYQDVFPDLMIDPDPFWRMIGVWKDNSIGANPLM